MEHPGALRLLAEPHALTQEFVFFFFSKCTEI